jgi:hypothetical protein
MKVDEVKDPTIIHLKRTNKFAKLKMKVDKFKDFCTRTQKTANHNSLSNISTFLI